MEYLCIMCIIISVPRLKMPCLKYPGVNATQQEYEEVEFFMNIYCSGKYDCVQQHKKGKALICSGLLPCDIIAITLTALAIIALVVIFVM